VYLGESFLPIALTGGIACGKSTVAQMLTDPRSFSTTSGIMAGGSSAVATANNAAAAAAMDQSLNSSLGTGSSSGNTNTNINLEKGKALKHRRRRSKGVSAQTFNDDTSSSALFLTPSTSVSASSSTSRKGGSLFGGGGNTSISGGVALSEEDEGSFYLVDTDSIAHEILLPPAVLAGEGGADANVNANIDEKKPYTVHPNESVYYDIIAAFGDEENDNQNILDEQGFIDRRKLGAIIFQDPSKRRRLNKITHPRIILIMLKRLFYGIFWSNQDLVCADVPLLFESGHLRWLFGIVITVACHPDVQYRRLRARNPDLTEQQCLERIASQMPIELKVRGADVCIWNNGDIDALAEQVERARRDIMGRMYGIGMSLLQMLLLVGGSLSLAVSSKLFSSWT